MKQLCLIILTVSFLVAGCASQGDWRIKSIQKKHPQWDQATVKKLAALQIEPGMTQEMVTAALGKPVEITSKEGETRWEFNGYRYNEAHGLVITHRYFVYFRDGKVTRTTGDPNRVGYR
jgi:outer membrane protein assembly factor BamE (lipoprotein component of BamABCDE complex)